MQDTISYSQNIPIKKGDNKMIQKNTVLIKIGKLLLDQGMLTLEEQKTFEQMIQEQL